METHDNLICCLQKQIDLYKKKQSSAKKEIMKLKRTMDCLEQERQSQRGQQDHMEEELSCLRAMCSKFTQGKEKLEKATSCKEDEIRQLCRERQDLTSKLERASTQLVFVKLKTKDKEENWDDAVDPETLFSAIRELGTAKSQLEGARTKIEEICQELETINSGESDEGESSAANDAGPGNEDEVVSLDSANSSESTLKEQVLSDSLLDSKTPKSSAKESRAATNVTKPSGESKNTAHSSNLPNKTKSKSGRYVSQSHSTAVPKSKTRSRSPGSIQPYQTSQHLSKSQPTSDVQDTMTTTKEKKYATTHLLHHCRTLSMQEMFGIPCGTSSLNSLCGKLGHSRIKNKKNKATQTDPITQASTQATTQVSGQGSKKTSIRSDSILRDSLHEIQSNVGSKKPPISQVQSKAGTANSSRRESVNHAKSNTEELNNTAAPAEVAEAVETQSSEEPIVSSE